MLKKISIMFLSLMFIFSVTSISFVESVEASSSKLVQIGEGEGVEASYILPDKIGDGGGSSKYKSVKVSSTKTVRTNPKAFPADIGLALVGLGGVYKLYQIPNALNKFLGWAGLSSSFVSTGNTTTYSVTMYTYWLKKPTMTSAGYYKYKIKNNKTGKTEYTKAYNIGKNGM